MSTYIAQDQYGQTIYLKTQHPRKELLELYHRKHADKIYCDPDSRHIGWIVAGHWFIVHKLSPLKG
jgi:hypothetical protein